jgi:CHAT domain-containing protein
MLGELHARFRNEREVTTELLSTLGQALYRPLLGPLEDRLGLVPPSGLGGRLQERFGVQRHRPLRLALDLDAARELAELPWELLHGGDQLGHLVARGRLAMLRRVAAQQTTELDPRDASAVHGRFRVLVAWATPNGMAFPATDEVDAITQAVNDAVTGDHVEVTAIANAGHTQLIDGLNGNVDVLHFVCHGDQRDGEPVLLLVDRAGDAHPLTLPRLIDILRASEATTRKPRLVVLSACRSADPAAGQRVSGFAAGLVEAGVVPAAIGMGYVVSARAAGMFSGRLYASLILHGQIEHAVADARSALRATFPDHRDWAVPRLYANDSRTAAFDLIGGTR